MLQCSGRRSQVALGLPILMYLMGTGLAAWEQTPDALGYSAFRFFTNLQVSRRTHTCPVERSDDNG